MQPGLMHTNISIELLCRADIDKAYLAQQHSQEAYSKEQILSQLQNPNSICLCAKAGDDIVGIVMATAVCDEADINNIATSPNFMRCGVARSLLTELVNRLCKIDTTKLYLEVRSQNIPAITLYEQSGFLRVGRRDNFYSQPTDDAYIYSKIISQKEIDADTGN